MLKNVVETGKKYGFWNLGEGEEIRIFGQNIYSCQANKLKTISPPSKTLEQP